MGIAAMVGAPVKRREDPRLITGQATYVDDIKLVGMLHMAVLRSPLARARIRSINATRAFTLPGVLVVITGELLARRNLAWMPTLSGDVQAILAVDEVRFQGQEVACVVAEERRLVTAARETSLLQPEEEHHLESAGARPQEVEHSDPSGFGGG